MLPELSRGVEGGQEKNETVDIQDVVEREGENERLGERHEGRVAIRRAQGKKSVDKQQQKGERKNELVPIHGRKMDTVPDGEPQQQRKARIQHDKDGRQPERSEMQAEHQMLAEELFPAPLQNRQHQGIEKHHDQHERAGLDLDHVVKGRRELGESGPLCGDPVRDHPGSQTTVGHHVQLDIKRGAQSCPSGVRLNEKVNQVGHKKELEGMQIRLTAAAQIFGREKARPGEEEPEAAKYLGVKMKELSQSVGEKVMNGQIS